MPGVLRIERHGRRSSTQFARRLIVVVAGSRWIVLLRRRVPRNLLVPDLDIVCGWRSPAMMFACRVAVHWFVTGALKYALPFSPGFGPQFSFDRAVEPDAFDVGLRIARGR